LLDVTVLYATFVRNSPSAVLAFHDVIGDSSNVLFGLSSAARPTISTHGFFASRRLVLARTEVKRTTPILVPTLQKTIFRT
jgi:hypothetical protein